MCHLKPLSNDEPSQFSCLTVLSEKEAFTDIKTFKSIIYIPPLIRTMLGEK